LRNANKTTTASEQRVLTFGALTLNMDTHILYIENPDVSDKSECKITRTEFAILKLLMQNPEQVVAKLTILDNISIDTPDCTEDSLKIHIHNLRKKLKEATGKELIKAVWGIGFMITSKS
jgi:DNA-binding response OmpR family regulator